MGSSKHDEDERRRTEDERRRNAKSAREKKLKERDIKPLIEAFNTENNPEHLQSILKIDQGNKQALNLLLEFYNNRSDHASQLKVIQYAKELKNASALASCISLFILELNRALAYSGNEDSPTKEVISKLAELDELERQQNEMLNLLQLPLAQDALDIFNDEAELRTNRIQQLKFKLNNLAKTKDENFELHYLAAKWQYLRLNRHELAGSSFNDLVNLCDDFLRFYHDFKKIPQNNYTNETRENILSECQQDIKQIVLAAVQFFYQVLKKQGIKARQAQTDLANYIKALIKLTNQAALAEVEISFNHTDYMHQIGNYCEDSENNRKSVDDVSKSIVERALKIKKKSAEFKDDNVKQKLINTIKNLLLDKECLEYWMAFEQRFIIANGEMSERVANLVAKLLTKDGFLSSSYKIDKKEKLTKEEIISVLQALCDRCSRRKPEIKDFEEVENYGFSLKDDVNDSDNSTTSDNDDNSIKMNTLRLQKIPKKDFSTPLIQEHEAYVLTGNQGRNLNAPRFGTSGINTQNRRKKNGYNRLGLG